MQIRRYYSSAVNYTDVLELSNPTIALAAAWACASFDRWDEVQTTLLYISSGRTSEEAQIQQLSMAEFIEQNRSCPPDAITIAAAHNNSKFMLQFILAQRVLSVTYPMSQIDLAAQLVKCIQCIIEQTYEETVKCIYTGSKGSRLWRRYECKNMQSSLDIAQCVGVALGIPDTILQWYIFRFQGVTAPADVHSFTKTEKAYTDEIIDSLPEGKVIISAQVVLLAGAQKVQIEITQNMFDIYTDAKPSAAAQKFTDKFLQEIRDSIVNGKFYN